MPLINMTTFTELRALSGDELLNELIDVFLEESAKMLAAMQGALETRDVDVFRRNAHSLKSNAETFGATTLAALARTLEATARAGSLDVGSGFEEMRTACHAAADELRGLRT